MVRKEYSAGGVKHPFWFLEFKKAAILRDQGVTWEGLRTRSREENLFSAASPARAEMTCNTVAARMQTLPDSFLPMFVFGDPATQKLFCLLGCMGNDTLFFDFCYEVIREKVQLGVNAFSDADIKDRVLINRDFGTTMKLSDETGLASYDTVMRRAEAVGIKQISLLYEAGLTDHGKTERRYAKPIIDRELEYWMKDNGLQPMYAALTGEN